MKAGSVYMSTQTLQLRKGTLNKQVVYTVLINILCRRWCSLKNGQGPVHLIFRVLQRIIYVTAVFNPQIKI